MTETAISQQSHQSIVGLLPVGLFGSVMGLTGLSVAWRQAQIRYEAPPWVAETIGLVALLTFIALVIGYLAKAAITPAAVVAEFRHPIAGKIFGDRFTA